jgi:flagellar hook-associated protein 3 FlgL
MTSRVTDMTNYNTFLNDIHTTSSRMSKTQAELSSGTQINNPEDDPFGAAQVMSFDGQITDNSTYQTAVSNGIQMLQAQDGALQSVNGAMSQIQTLVVQAGGITSQADLNAIAAQIQQLKEVVRDGANTQYGSIYVFGGTATNAQPYPVGSNAYAGTNVQMSAVVAPGQQVNTNIPGANVFGTTVGAAPNQMNTFDLIDHIVTDLQTGTPVAMADLQGPSMQALAANVDVIRGQQAVIGASTNRLQSVQTQLTSQATQLAASKSSVADVDFTKAYTDYQSENTMYQAALAAGSRIMQTSLLDFLK